VKEMRAVVQVAEEIARAAAKPAPVEERRPVRPPRPRSPEATAPAPPATAPAAGGDQPSTGGRVRFAPAQVESSVSGNFSVSLLLDGVTDAATAPIQIQFDPKVLRLNDVARGDLFSRDGQQPTFIRDYRNDSGTATIQLSRMPGSPGVSGSGALVVLNFQAVGRGTTVVSAPSLVVRNSLGQTAASGSAQVAVNVK